ncbi:MAG: hypothetical protein RBR08_10760 [Desulforegulaceae bacterium]|nr:hypothetical protein [Desulforegulaceae bacterium]
MKFKLYLVLFSLLPLLCKANIIEIKYFQKDQRYIYRLELLKLALSKSANEKETIVYQPFNDDITEARGLYFLKNKPELINIAFIPTNKERENSFLAIKKPVLFGMLGYRIFLIHKDNKSKFENINSIRPFVDKTLVCGFSPHWADMEILKYNNINTVGIAVYEHLFKTLNHKRFDYFPRGINEVWQEFESKKNKYKNIIIEDNLAFYYPCPVYFFLNKKDTKLAKKIEKGLDLAEKDGSFKELFLKHYKETIKKSHLSKRKILFLKHPEITEQTTLDSLWWMNKY